MSKSRKAPVSLLARGVRGSPSCLPVCHHLPALFRLFRLLITCLETRVDYERER